MRVRIGYTTSAIIGNGIPNTRERGLERMSEQENVADISHGSMRSASAFAPNQKSYACHERYAALNTPIRARTRMMRYFFIERKCKEIKLFKKTPRISRS